MMPDAISPSSPSSSSSSSLGPEYASMEDESFVAKYSASCHCGAVRYETSADPVDSKVCHCRACQKLHGAPIQWAAIFEKHHVRLVTGMEHLKFYNTDLDEWQRTPLPCKVQCGRCGTWIADEGRRMWLAFPSLFDVTSKGLEQMPTAFRPSCHIFYGARVMDVKDGVPKWSGHKNKSTLMDLP